MNQLLKPEILHHNIDFDVIKPDDFIEAFNLLIPQVIEENEYMLEQAPLEYDALFEFMPKKEQLGMVMQILFTLNSLVQNNEIKEIEENYMPELSALYQKMFLDIRGYNKIEQYKLTENYTQQSEIHKKVIEDVLFNLKMGGVNLSQEKKVELEKIAYQLSELSTKFDNNLNEVESKLEINLSLDELTGLPTRAMQGMIEINGKYKISQSSGLYTDILTYCDVEETRKKIYEQLQQIGIKEGFDNREILQKIIELKQHQAKILGFDNYAQLALVKRMVKNSDEVFDFVNHLGNSSIKAAIKESEILEKQGWQILNKKPSFHDQKYITYKVKEKIYKINNEELRKYFPVRKSVNGLFDLLRDLYEINFIENKSYTTWHIDVIAYDVIDNKTNNKLGVLYMDLYKRKFKTSGAWMNSVVNRHITKIENKLPVAYIVCNIPKDMGQETTLDFEEIITLFHEMGHALHHLLTDVDIEYYSGLNNVEQDAIELPSQLMENFCWDYHVIEMISSHIITGDKLPKEEFDKLLSMKNYLSAISMIRQIIFAELDMRIHNNENKNAMDIEREVLEKWKVKDIDTNACILPSFTHIMSGGYSAGYYSYKWAEVLSADVFGAFQEAGKNYKEQKLIANNFRKTILARGGINKMADNFFEFRGREPDINYLLKESGIE